MTELTIQITTPLDRRAALDRRDGIIGKLRELGLKVVATDNGTEVFMAAEGASNLLRLGNASR